MVGALVEGENVGFEEGFVEEGFVEGVDDGTPVGTALGNVVGTVATLHLTTFPDESPTYKNAPSGLCANLDRTEELETKVLQFSAPVRAFLE